MERRRILGIGLVALASMVTVYATYAIITQLTIPSNGKVMVLDAFWDSGATNRTTSINWGDVWPNTTYTKSIWVKNYGGKAVNLSMAHGDWNPTNALDYMKLTWNRQAYNLTSGFVIEAVFTLTVHANVTEAESAFGAFSCNIVITGEST